MTDQLAPNLIPPQDVEAEQCLLGSILINNDIFHDVAGIIKPGDLYRTAHRKIFTAITVMARKNEPIDLVTLKDTLSKKKQLEDVGGAMYLSRLTDDIPYTGNAQHYAKIIREKACLRNIIQVANKAAKRCFEDIAPAVEILDDTQREINNIGFDGQDSTFCSMEDLTLETYESIEMVAQGKAPKGVNTGIPTLDLVTGGLVHSKLVVLGGRPRMGKTSLQNTIARNVARSGHKVGIFSIEMDRGEIDIGLLSMESGVNSLKLRSGKGMNADDWKRISEASERKCKWPLIIDDTGALPIMELCRRARQMRREGCEIIFIDQFSKIKGDRRRSKFEEATEIVEILGDLKKELRIPIVLLAQINRKLEERTIKKPTLSDLKNTGQLEEEADLVLLLHRESVYDDKADKREANLEVAKHRGGPCRDIPLRWIAKQTRFYEEHQSEI